MIHREDPDGGASHRGNSEDLRAVHREVIGPAVAARMEQGYDIARDRIDPGKVWTFVQIATVARQGQISRIIRPAVLFRDDVFHLVGKVAKLLIQQAVFAPVPRSPPHEFPERPIHV
jgi:hypothetical protein